MMKNRIILTNEIFKEYSKQINNKDAIVITPFTKLSDILIKQIKSTIFEKIYESFSKLAKDDFFSEVSLSVNSEFNIELIDYNFNFEKVIKTMFTPSNELVTNENILDVIYLLEKTTTKIIDVYIFGFENKDIVMKTFNMLNINFCTTYTRGVVNWDTLGYLYIQEHDLDIINKEKLISWLEEKTNNVVMPKDLDDYFNGVVNINTMLIERAFSTL